MTTGEMFFLFNRSKNNVLRLLFRMYVISVLPTLQYLDDSAITEAQRQQANSNKRAYALSGGPLRFIEKFGSTMFLNMFKNGRENSNKQSLGTGETRDVESTIQLGND